MNGAPLLRIAAVDRSQLSTDDYAFHADGCHFSLEPRTEGTTKYTKNTKKDKRKGKSREPRNGLPGGKAGFPVLDSLVFFRGFLCISWFALLLC
jgi:hypothetical protein